VLSAERDAKHDHDSIKDRGPTKTKSLVSVLDGLSSSFLASFLGFAAALVVASSWGLATFVRQRDTRAGEKGTTKAERADGTGGGRKGQKRGEMLMVLPQAHPVPERVQVGRLVDTIRSDQPFQQKHLHIHHNSGSVFLQISTKQHK
jgi:hypothetical protein